MLRIENKDRFGCWMWMDVVDVVVVVVFFGGVGFYTFFHRPRL